MCHGVFFLSLLSSYEKIFCSCLIVVLLNKILKYGGFIIMANRFAKTPENKRIARDGFSFTQNNIRIIFYIYTNKHM